MVEKYVLFPTLRKAINEFERLQKTYPNMLVKAQIHPMTLESVHGVRYIFCTETEADKMRGTTAEFISLGVAVNELSIDTMRRKWWSKSSNCVFIGDGDSLIKDYHLPKDDLVSIEHE